MGALKHICGKCGRKFNSESLYLKHVCSETGSSPLGPKHGEVIYKAPKKKSSSKGKVIAINKARRKRERHA